MAMRILFCESGSIWSRGLPDGLRDLGHTVRISGPLTHAKIQLQLRRFRPQLILSVGWGVEHTKEKQIWIGQCAKSAHIPLVYWATEDPNFTKEYTLPLIRRMKPDFVFTVSAKTAKLYRTLGITAAPMDFGFHPSIHRRLSPSEPYRCDVAVVANAYPNVLRRYPHHYRRRSLDLLIRPLLQRGIRVDFYGKDWANMSPFLGRRIPPSWIYGPIGYQNASKVYSSAKIVLGLQNYTDMVTQRTYEILGSGGFLVTCNTPGVRSLFTPDRDLVVSSSPQQTVQLVQRYLNDPKSRERIRIQGRKTVAHHTYTNRAKYMIRVLRQHGLV